MVARAGGKRNASNCRRYRSRELTSPVRVRRCLTLTVLGAPPKPGLPAMDPNRHQGGMSVGRHPGIRKTGSWFSLQKCSGRGRRQTRQNPSFCLGGSHERPVDPAAAANCRQYFKTTGRTGQKTPQERPSTGAAERCHPVVPQMVLCAGSGRSAYAVADDTCAKAPQKREAAPLAEA